VRSIPVPEQRFDDYDDQDEYEWLRRDCEFRVAVVEDGYVAREVVSVGEWLYDPQLRWTEPDGCVVISDIGGQPTREFDPHHGHGALWRLSPDNRLSTIIDPGMGGLYAPLRPVLAPPSFGDLGGHVLTIAQTASGRDGAHNRHACYEFAPGSPVPRELFELPNSGLINGGVPAAGMPGVFGPEGTAHEGYFFCQSLVNCTIYRADSTGHVEPYIVLGPPDFDRPMMPYLMWIAPDFGPWAEYAGRIIVGTRSRTYMDESDHDLTLTFFALDPEKPILEPVTGVTERPGVIAPPSFGRFAGHMFTVNEGSTNLLHSSITELNAAPLAYDARIVRMAPDGSLHTFAEGIQGGSTIMAFTDDRLVVTCARKSYSTGEYHEPDGSVFEVRALGD
jgi:hypothetical protein